MPELPVIGQQENPDVEPITIPIAAYAIKSGKEIVEKFAFKPTLPAPVLALVERMGGRLQIDAANLGNGIVSETMTCLKTCVMADERDRWDEWIDREDISIEAETLVEVFKALFEEYAERPTRPRSDSSGTGSRSRSTSKAARS